MVMSTLLKPMPISEKRWREASGERYLKNGVTFRCQAVSKTRLRLRREETGNPELTAEDVWPHLQCIRAALEGVYLCKYHGGMSSGMKKHSVLAFASGSLQETLSILLESPDYLSTKKEILLMRAYIWKLVQELEGLGGAAVWGSILSAVDIIEGGDIAKGARIIREAAESRKLDQETLNEIRNTTKVLQGLTNTEVTSAEKLQTMASQRIERNVLQRVAAGIRDFTGAVAYQPSGEVRGSGE
jgi:hypothetical protein